MRLEVNVTPADIAAGELSCNCCPIALAATRALRALLGDQGGDLHAEFDHESTDWPGGLSIHRRVLENRTRIVGCVPARSCPREAIDFAKDFDAWKEGEWDGPPGPVSFAVDLEDV